MKKKLVLLNLMIFIFSLPFFGAVDIKKETRNINQEKELQSQQWVSKKSKSDFSRTRKFKLRDLFKWKKKRKNTTEKEKKRIPKSATNSLSLIHI